MKFQKIKLENGKTVGAWVTEWTDGTSSAEDKNGNTYSVVDRDYDGAVWAKDDDEESV